MNDITDLRVRMDEQRARDPQRQADCARTDAMPSSIFKALAPFMPPESAVAEQMRQYRAMLAGLDWTFEFSDDSRVWKAGYDTLAELRKLQRELDPDGAIWVAAMPRDGFGNLMMGAPLPVVKE